MANLTKRIIDLQTTSTLGSDDYVMVDGATNGTKKYLLKDILDEIEDIKEGTALATGAVTTDKLAAGAVTNAKIGDGAVDTTNIADDAVTAAKIDDGAVGTDALAANAVTGAKIATGAVGTGNIASGAVTLDKIASDSNATSSRNGLMSSADKAKLDGFSAASNYALKSDIVGAYIFKGSVNTENDLPSTDLTVGDVYNIISASSYGESGANVAWTGSAWDALGESFDISDGAIDTEQLADGAVTNDKLAEEAMTTVSPTGTIYDDSTYGSSMRQGYAVTFGNSDTTITLPKVNSDLLIDVENIPTIPEKKIGSSAVTANKIAAGAVGTEKLANSAVTTDKLATAAVSTDKIASLAVTTNKIAAGAVDNSKLANNAVGTAQIANGAVTSEKLDSDITDAIDSKAAASDVTALSTRVDEELENKADIDGYYSQLTAGLAENLIGRGDAVPAEYLYRTAGGTADIEDGIATIDCIKGNALVWNQLAQYSTLASTTKNDVLITNNKDGSYTISGTWAKTTGDRNYYQLVNPIDVVSGHKYLMKCSCKYLNMYMYGSTGSPNTGFQPAHADKIWTAQENYTMYVSLLVPNDVNEVGFTANETFYVQLFDLTLMFGTGNEPTTVAEFEAMFLLPYYPYSASKLLPVDIRGIETVGFNLLEDASRFNKTKNQYANSLFGLDVNALNAFKDNLRKLKLLGQNLYWHIAADNLSTNSTISVGTLIIYGETLSTTLKTIQRDTVFSLSNLDIDRIGYVILYGPSPSTTVTFSEACISIVWSGYRNGEYEEHWSAERPIDTSLFFPTGMKKIGSKADALYADHYDTVIGAVDLGTLTWVEYTGGTEHSFRTAATTPIPRANGVTNVWCATYETGTSGNLLENMQIAGGANSSTVYVRNNTFDTAANVKAALSGVILYYELATPTTTEIDPPLNLSYKVSDFGTEKVMVDEEADAPQTAPVPMEVEYGINAIDTIRRLPKEYQSHKSMGQLTAALESSLGVEITETWDENDQRYEYEATPFELADDALACIATPDGPVATANHAINTYLTMQGKLYKVTTAIAAGETIAAGTNVTQTTVMDELIALTA